MTNFVANDAGNRRRSQNGATYRNLAQGGFLFGRIREADGALEL